MNKIKGYWTYDMVKNDALKYKKRNDFNRNSKSAYLAAHRNGWLDEVCSHMKSVNNYTFDKVKLESSKYLTRSEFKKNSLPYYNAAHRNGWLDEVCSHMKPQGSLYKRYVYKVSFDDKSIYIGLTYNFDRRKSEHLISGNSSVHKHIIQTGLKPNFYLLTDLLSIEDAVKIECELISYYKNIGFNILNKVKGGGLGSSNIIWTLDKVKGEALKFNTRNDFKKNSPSPYQIAYRNGWLDEVCSHMRSDRKPKGYWTLDKVKEEALKFNSRKEFERESSAYQIAYRNGWLDEVCSHMRVDRKPKGYWTLNKVKEEALKFNSRNDFKKNSSSAYYLALSNKCMDDICNHMK